MHVDMFIVVKESIFFDSIWKDIENIKDMTWFDVLVSGSMSEYVGYSSLINVWQIITVVPKLIAITGSMVELHRPLVKRFLIMCIITRIIANQ